MKVIDAKNIIGRGPVLICEYDPEIKAGEYITVEGKEYKISGVEYLNQRPRLMGVVIARQDESEQFKGKEICYI